MQVVIILVQIYANAQRWSLTVYVTIWWRLIMEMKQIYRAEATNVN